MPTTVSNGITMYYEVRGAGLPVVFLHGLGSRSDDWQLQLPVFAKRYRVVVADMRGHGLSEKPRGPYSVPMMAADVLSLLDVLGIEAAHFIGLSMGGMIAFQLAVDRPERVSSLVIVNSGPALVPRTLRQRLQVAQRLALARLFGPGRTGRFLSKRLFPKPEQADLRARFVEQWAQNDPAAYLAAMRALVGWSVQERIGAIHCPTLIISGDRDYTPVEAKRDYATRIPGAALVVVEDSGHATPIDQAERFNAIVLNFLQAGRVL